MPPRSLSTTLALWLRDLRMPVQIALDTFSPLQFLAGQALLAAAPLLPGGWADELGERLSTQDCQSFEDWQSYAPAAPAQPGDGDLP